MSGGVVNSGFQYLNQTKRRTYAQLMIGTYITELYLGGQSESKENKIGMLLPGGMVCQEKQMKQTS